MDRGHCRTGDPSVQVDALSPLNPGIGDHAYYMDHADTSAGNLGHGGVLQPHDEAEQEYGLSVGPG
jgi:hypothetical protein